MSYIPDAPHIYQGKQVIIDSDRLIFNAKADSILLFSDKAIGFSTNGSFNFDTSDKKDSKFVVNSPNIYLGLKEGDLPTEPVILGHRMQEWMIGDDLTEGLLDVLEDILDMIGSEISYIAPPSGPTTPNAANIIPIERRIGKLNTLKKAFKENLSNQVKTI
jgi:hypothetical protein|tara:strand:+ start:1727 stop:2209 length:483 start_codon:yes stop_codon:yes gene_type:complete